MGEYRTNPSHGFGGITGKVELVATDKLYIGDVLLKTNRTLILLKLK